jgi:FSR family fosmidomycin resistance protein-like MFS transporter
MNVTYSEADTLPPAGADAEITEVQHTQRVVSCYAVTHFLVDATSVAILCRAIGRQELNVLSVGALVLTYDLLAFGLQPFVGLSVDKKRTARLAAAVGCLLAALPVATVSSLPIVSVCVAGIGNALFHVGGGAVTLHLAPRRSAAPGIFIAPGALGLAMGATMGVGMPVLPWITALLLVAASIFILTRKVPQTHYSETDTACPISLPGLAIALLLFVTVVRSLIGMTMALETKASVVWLMSLALAAAVGKAFGGVLADRLGWRLVTVATLLASAPLLSFAGSADYLALPGMLLFQVPTGVVVTAIALVYPGRPAFAFGLTSLALMTGAFPVFTELRGLLYGQWVSFLLTCTSAVALWLGLRQVLGKSSVPASRAAAEV